MNILFHYTLVNCALLVQYDLFVEIKPTIKFMIKQLK